MTHQVNEQIWKVGDASMVRCHIDQVARARVAFAQIMLCHAVGTVGVRETVELNTQCNNVAAHLLARDVAEISTHTPNHASWELAEHRFELQIDWVSDLLGQSVCLSQENRTLLPIGMQETHVLTRREARDVIDDVVHFPANKGLRDDKPMGKRPQPPRLRSTLRGAPNNL